MTKTNTMKRTGLTIYLIFYALAMPVLCALLLEEFTCYEDVTVRQGQVVSLVAFIFSVLTGKGLRKVVDDYKATQ